MKIPKTVKIKTKTYSIEFDGEALRDDDIYGRVYHTKQKIILDKTQKIDMLQVAFLHELLHAIVNAGALRKELSNDIEEKVVTQLAEDLLLVIKENQLDFRNMTK